MLEELMKFAVKKQTEVSEFLIGTIALLWGVWLLIPIWDTFRLFSYTNFILIAPENTWGLVCASVGLLTVIASTTTWINLRKIMALIQIALWVFVAITFASVVPGNTEVPVYIMLSVASFWVYVRLVFMKFAYK